MDDSGHMKTVILAGGLGTRLAEETQVSGSPTVSMADGMSELIEWAQARWAA